MYFVHYNAWGSDFTGMIYGGSSQTPSVMFVNLFIVSLKKQP